MKTCTLCKKEKNLDDFYSRKSGPDKGKYYARCKECTKLKRFICYDKNKDKYNESKRDRRKNDSEYRKKIKRQKRESYRKNILTSRISLAKARAKKYNLEFDLTVDDLTIPEFCPLLEIKLEIGKKGDYENSPSLDRINPKKGYTKDNVWIISKKANSMKNSATIEELKTFFKNVQSKLM